MTQVSHEAARHDEPHGGGMATRLNWLRAAVLTAGLAGLFAGALAMASGEYVSVSSQRDSERAMLALERRELAEAPDAEVAELGHIYHAKGLAPLLARHV